MLMIVLIEIVHTYKNHIIREQSQYSQIILRKQCPNNMSRSNLLRKLYNWFLLAGLLHHHFHIQSPKTKEEEGETGKLYKKRRQSNASHKHL